ncbi:MAG TPA: BatA domain-containing protein [Planctomycetaceae bacterium]|nr:BatA domain-containing protein [Planctomycetaceae bacterium]
MPWFLSHFFNPAFLAGGAALLALPVIIHLINRLRYRRVKFAAMEFLLQSQQRNRRRILFEQLLLLLMRMAIVAGIVLLISRLILDPSQLSIFRGAKAHHVVLLDDSGSMRERWGETSAFKEGLTVVNQLLAEGAQRPDTQTFSLMRLSRSEQPFVSQRDVNEAFVLEMATKLEPQTFECTHQSLDLVAGLRTALKFLQEEKGTVQQLHVVSDFREADWKDQKAIAGVIEELTAAGVTVNLVKTVPAAQPNLAVTELSAAVQVAAAGVPLRVKVGVTNYGDAAAKNIGVTVSDDGVKLPVTVLFDEIEARTTAYHELDVRLTTATQHRLAAQLDADPLAQDNARYLAVDVSPAVPVLIIEGNPQDDAASFVADALAADPASTGVSITLDSPDGLRRRSLDEFRVIYLLNVAELPADAVDALDRFVRSGGGLMWFLGDVVRPAHYNDALYHDGDGIFPVRLGLAPEPLPADPTAVEVDLQPTDHPVFAVMLGQDNPFLASVHVRQSMPVADDWVRDDQRRGDSVHTIATLRNRMPFLVERTLGQGRVMACLTTADPVWNDWARNPSFVVFQLDLLKHIARRDRGLPQRIVGEPIQLSLDPAVYSETVEIISPAAEGGRTTRLQAAPELPAGESEGTAAKTGTLALTATYRDTDEPGVYRVQVFNQAQQPESRMFAYNVPVAESDLALATTANLRKRIGDSGSVSIQEPGQFTWLQGQEAGSEIRQWLLWGLLALLLGEQVLAYRMSYHPATRAVSAAA